MLFIALFVIVMIFYYFYVKNTPETFISNDLGHNMYFNNEYIIDSNRVVPNDVDPLRYYNNTHNFLNVPVIKGNETYNNVKPLNSTLVYKKLDNKMQSYTSTKPVSEKNLNKKIRNKIRKFQSPIYGSKCLSLTDRNGDVHYNDWRYPEQPISIKFSMDPVKYCTKNQNRYPCAKFMSKY
jgi:hypothetical protein